MAEQSTKITALYCRLSVEDRVSEGDSNSIVNQKEMLARYANEHGFGNTKFFVDDGVSGTLFSRPGLDAMLDEVRAGNVAVAIFKDQSRIGRDVLEVGLLKRTFEENDVRYIAAADGLDSANGFDIMSIFRDVFNEYFVADTSRKIRAVHRSNALKGKSAGRLPYGYKRGENNETWEVDEESAAVVREIFKAYISGKSIPDICRDLTARGILTPDNYRYKRLGATDPWRVSSMCPMLEERAYIGTFAVQKSTTVSYKNHKRVYRPEDEWVVIQNHHTPLLDLETWDTAQRLRGGRRKYNKLGEKSILSGLLRCADCDSTLSYARQGPGGSAAYFICRTYRSADCNNNHMCTRHGIKVSDIEAIVLAKIQETVGAARSNERGFAEMVYKSANKDTEKAIKSKTAELGKAERRIAELDTIISRIYEDNVSGKISDERFNKMLAGFEAEQAKITATAEMLRNEIDDLKSKTANLQSFMNIVARVGEITELTDELARMFIEKVVVHEAVFKTETKRAKESQQIDIYFSYIGRFDTGNVQGEIPSTERCGGLIVVN